MRPRKTKAETTEQLEIMRWSLLHYYSNTEKVGQMLKDLSLPWNLELVSKYVEDENFMRCASLKFWIYKAKYK